jgi:hypothetical protein
LQDFLNALGMIAVVWVVVAFMGFGELGCANFIAVIGLLFIFGMAIQNFFIWISPYLIWLALVPLVPAGLWLGKVLEKRLATGNPVPKAKNPNQIPPF